MKHKDYYWVIILIGCILIIIAPSILTLPWRDEVLGLNTNFKSTGQIGDTIGGITAPIIGLVSIWLLYITFKEQQKFNLWTTAKDTLSRIEKILSTYITIEVHELEDNNINGKTNRVPISELSALLTEYKLELSLNDGRLLLSYLKKIILNINKYLKLDPEISTDLNTDIIKNYVSTILSIYSAVENKYITFQLGVNNLAGDEEDKSDDEILIQLFEKDKALFEKLPSEYLPDKHKKE